MVTCWRSADRMKGRRSTCRGSRLLDDQALLSIANAALSDEDQRRLVDLSARDTLTAQDQHDLQTLRDAYGQVTLRKARAFALLSIRSGKGLMAVAQAA